MLRYTARLLIRDLSPEDAPALLAMDCDPEVMRFIAGARGTEQTLDLVLERISRLITLPERNPSCGFWAVEVTETGEFIGLCGLIPLDKTKEIEIAYRYIKSSWGHGYATEAAQSVLAYGLEELGLTSISAVTVPENVASRAVLEKIGLVYRGEGRYYDLDLSYYTTK